MSTNLAKRPFRNERLPWLAAVLLMGVAIIVTGLHARQIVRLLGGDEANTVRAVRADESRIASLQADLAKEPPLKVDAAELSRLRALKELVDRRVFPWRLLLSELEATLAEDVRLTRIQPRPTKDGLGVMVELTGSARSKDAAFTLAEALAASPAFSNSVLKSLSENEGETEFSIEVLFLTERKAGLP